MKLRITSLSTILFIVLLEAYFLMQGVYAALELNSPFSIFWLDVYSVPLRLTFTCLIIPVTIVAVIFIIIKRKDVNFRFSVVILFMLILTNVIGFLALPSGIARYTEQQAGLKFEDRIYQVAHSYADIGLADAHPELDLYECDTWGILCHRIFRYKQLKSKPTIDWSEIHLWQSKLLPDPAAYTVTLQINGEAVYVHPVK